MKVRNRRRSSRGAATIEAILALSVFILVWVGVLYMGRVYSAKLELKSRVRACAWIQSANACRVEVDCSTSLGGNDQEAGDDLKGKFGGAALGFLKERLEKEVAKIFGERATMSASAEFARPVHLGGEQVSVSASYSLPCNTKPVSSETIAGQLIELIKEELF